MSTDRRKMFLKREQVGGGETPQAFNKQFSFILVLCLFHVSQLRLKGLQVVQIFCSGPTHVTKLYIFHRRWFPFFLLLLGRQAVVYFRCPLTDLLCKWMPYVTASFKKSQRVILSNSVCSVSVGLSLLQSSFFFFLMQFPLKISHEKLIGSHYQ